MSWGDGMITAAEALALSTFSRHSDLARICKEIRTAAMAGETKILTHVSPEANAVTCGWFRDRGFSIDIDRDERGIIRVRDMYWIGWREPNELG